MGDLTFFDDPAIDKVYGVVMQLAQELYALRQRVRALEGGQSDTLSRDAFVDRILAPLTEEAESPDPAFQAP